MISAMGIALGRRITVQIALEKKLKTLPEKLLTYKRGGDMAQVVEHLPVKCKA
jgi:hypothetical protein